MAEEATPVDAAAQQADLAAQYDFESATPEPEGLPPETAPATPPAPPRDPATGRFLPSGPDAPAEVSSPSISPWLLRMADDLAIPVDGLSEESLAAAVSATQRHVMRSRQESANAQAREVPREQVVPVTEPDLLPEWTAENVNEELAKPLKKIMSAMQKRIDSLEKQLGAVRDSHVRREAETHGEAVDRIIESFGDDRFGSGPMSDLGNTPAASKRLALHAEAIRLAGGNKATGSGILSKLKQARANLYGDEAPEPPTRKANRPTAADYAKGALGKPTHRAGSVDLPDGPAKAAREVAALMREQGVNGTITPDTDEDFPD